MATVIGYVVTVCIGFTIGYGLAAMIDGVFDITANWGQIPSESSNIAKRELEN